MSQGDRRGANRRDGADRNRRRKGRNPNEGGATGGDRELEAYLAESLDSLPRPAARAEFRSALRERFLRAASDPSAESTAGSGAGQAFGAGVWSQTDARPQGASAGQEPTEGKVQSVEDLLDDWVPEPAAEPFRAQLRERFLASAEEADSMPIGELAETSSDDSDQPAHARHAVASKPRVEPRRRRSTSDGTKGARRAPAAARGQRRRTWGFVALAAAAVLAFFLIPDGQPKTSGWRVLDGGKVALVDGQAVTPASDGAMLLGLGAQSVTAGEELLRLKFLDQMVVEIDPGGSLEISNVRPDGGLENAEGGSDWVLSMLGENGGYRVATLPDFKREDRRLLFRTPDAEVEVVGTVFGVDRYQGTAGVPNGTCVCCCDGEVQVRHTDNAVAYAVTSGKSGFAHTGTDDLTQMSDMPKNHAGPLKVLAASYHSP